MRVNRGRNPKYLELYQKLRQDITEKRYLYGEKLPSKRLLAEERALSVITVEHCYDLLLEEGYIESRERSGYYVIFREDFSFPVGDPFTGKEKREERDRSSEETQPVNHTWGKTENNSGAMRGGEASGQNSECIPFTILAKTIRHVLSEYGEKLCVKSPGNGLPEFREAISAYLRRSRGINVDKEQIIIGSGAEYLYSLLVQMLGRDKVYGLEKPSYQKIEKIYRSLGADCELLKLGAEGILSEELKKTRAEILHVTPFNSFPSGITASASKRREYIRWAESRGAVIIEDDFDSEFSMSTKVEDTLFSLEPERTVLYMNSFSKTVAPSFRVAYLILPRELREELRRAVSFYSCTVPVMDQYILTELIQNGDFERHINRVRRKRRRNL